MAGVAVSAGSPYHRLSQQFQRLKAVFRLLHYSPGHYGTLDRKIRVNVAKSGPRSSELVSQCARELGMEVVR